MLRPNRAVPEAPNRAMSLVGSIVGHGRSLLPGTAVTPAPCGPGAGGAQKRHLAVLDRVCLFPPEDLGVAVVPAVGLDGDDGAAGSGHACRACAMVPQRSLDPKPWRVNTSA